MKIKCDFHTSKFVPAKSSAQTNTKGKNVKCEESFENAQNYLHRNGGIYATA